MEQLLKNINQFLFGEVYINKIKADVGDKLKFWKDYTEGCIKCRTYQYNGIIDIITED